MAAEDRGEGPGLSRDLFDAPYRFDFFQAVRILEHRRRELERPRRGGPGRAPSRPHAPVGHDDPGNEFVRFRALPSLSFPPGAIARLVEAAGDRGDGRPAAPSEMVVSFLGLTGPSGVLPRHYTELMLNRIRDKDHSLRDFLDLFNHRLISLFYRAWEKFRLPLGYERSRSDDPDRKPDLATWALYCLVGLGTEGLRGRSSVDDRVFLYFGGHFAHFPRSASALEGLLGEYLGPPVRIEPLQGQWLVLGRENQASMPDRLHAEGRNNQLGVNLIVGERFWDIQSKFRVRVGPLDWELFRSLMPVGSLLEPLRDLTRSYVGPDLDFDVQPVVESREVPDARLSENPDDGLYLGWNSWICGPFADDLLDDAVFQD